MLPDFAILIYIDDYIEKNIISLALLSLLSSFDVILQVRWPKSPDWISYIEGFDATAAMSIYQVARTYYAIYLRAFDALFRCQ